MEEVCICHIENGRDAYVFEEDCPIHGNSKPKNHEYIRHPYLDVFSVEGSKTGYLLRMYHGKLSDNEYISDEYFEMIKQELKTRGFTDNELFKLK